jgi:hypothetical protein
VQKPHRLNPEVRMGNSTWWAPEEVVALEKLLDAGHDVETIATVLLSRKPQAIRDKVRQLGRELPRNTPQIDLEKLNLLVKV